MKTPGFLVSALLFQVACAGKSSGAQQQNPTLCDLALAAEAVVQCQFTVIGQQATAQQATLPAPSSTIPLMLATPYGADLTTPMVQLTLNASNPLKGSLTGTVSAWANAYGASAAYAPTYADGTAANGYCFLMQAGGQWILESTGYFRQDEQAPTVYRNLTFYSSGISQQALLSGVAAAPAAVTSTSACPLSGPITPAPMGLPPPGRDAGTGNWPPAVNDSPTDGGNSADAG
jgi:hypothetical protein